MALGEVKPKDELKERAILMLDEDEMERRKKNPTKRSERKREDDRTSMNEL